MPDGDRAESLYTDKQKMFNRRKLLQQPQASSMRFHDERGQNIVEFAVTLLILIFLTVGLIETARLAYAISVVRAATQAGARSGLVNPADVTPTVEEQMVGLDPTQIEIAVSYPASNRVEVQVVYHFQFVLPILFPFFGGDALDISSTASISG